MVFHKTNLGFFSEKIPSDMDGYTPEAHDDNPWGFTIDHQEVTHNDDGSLTDYGQWWEEEGFPAWKYTAIKETKLAERRLRKWHNEQE